MKDIEAIAGFREIIDENPSRFYSNMLSGLSGLCSNIHLFFCFLPFSKLPQISIHGDVRGSLRKISAKKFMEYLYQPFPILCAWKLCSTSKKYNGVSMQLDGCSGNECPAWQELNKANLTIWPRGDQCNALISTADLIGHCINSISFNRHEKFAPNSIKQMFPANPPLLYDLGHDLKKIAPNKPTAIKTTKFYHKCKIFVLMPKSPFNISNSELFDKSPHATNLYNRAFARNAFVKLFDEPEDFKAIDAQSDEFFYLGDSGKEKAEYIKSMGYKINAVPVESI